MYNEMKNNALKMREKAIENNIPIEFLHLADGYFNKAIFWREHLDTKSSRSDRRFNKAIEGLQIVIDIFDAHLNNSFSKHPYKLLQIELNKTL